MHDLEDSQIGAFKIKTIIIFSIYVLLSSVKIPRHFRNDIYTIFCSNQYANHNKMTTSGHIK